MALKTVEFKKLSSVLVKGLLRPTKKSFTLMQGIGLQLQKDTDLTFKFEGSPPRYDRPRWERFSPKTMRTEVGTPKIRYGTDLRPLDKMRLSELKSKWGWGRRGFMRKGVRRYTSRSKLLQASGGFRSSFHIIKVNRSKVKFGTDHKLAGKIGANPERQIIHFTAGDRERYTRVVNLFTDRELKY
jgi:hypothetical protein